MYVWWDIFLNEWMRLPATDMKEEMLRRLRKEGVVVFLTPL